MLIQIKVEKAEEQFLDALEENSRHSVNRAVLVCKFSDIDLNLTADDVLPLLKDVLADHKAELYFCRDGDLAICWIGKAKEILETVTSKFMLHYPSQLPMDVKEKIFQFYDTHVHGEDLRLLFRKKLHKVEEQDKMQKEQHAQQLVAQHSWIPDFTPEQQLALKKSIYNRITRKGLEVLIVEDQMFSRRLLAGLLERQYRCDMAKNAEEAVRLYADHAPNIVFLDIELPDSDGHTLAALFKKYDPGSYIVMVTGNNYARDVEAAKTNKVQGFIVKPYQKQRILSVIDAYKNRKR